jgi:hypothetical protein
MNHPIAARQSNSNAGNDFEADRPSRRLAES